MKTIKEYNEKHKPYRVKKVCAGCYHLLNGASEKSVGRFDSGRFKYDDDIDQEPKKDFETVILARLRGW